MSPQKPRNEAVNGLHNLFPPQQQFPLVALDQLKRELQAQIDQSKADLERQREEVNLQLLKVGGMVNALREALPVVDRVFGDPNENLSALSNIILERGCDVAERCVEITLNPDA